MDKNAFKQQLKLLVGNYYARKSDKTKSWAEIVSFVTQNNRDPNNMSQPLFTRFTKRMFLAGRPRGVEELWKKWSKGRKQILETSRQIREGSGISSDGITEIATEDPITLSTVQQAILGGADAAFPGLVIHRAQSLILFHSSASFMMPIHSCGSSSGMWAVSMNFVSKGMTGFRQDIIAKVLPSVPTGWTPGSFDKQYVYKHSAKDPDMNISVSKKSVSGILLLSSGGKRMYTITSIEDGNECTVANIWMTGKDVLALMKITKDLRITISSLDGAQHSVILFSVPRT